MTHDIIIPIVLSVVKISSATPILVVEGIVGSPVVAMLSTGIVKYG